MTRNARQRRIIELIKERDIETQEDLVSLLQSSGFNVTQATVSRDIKDLGLIKSQTISGSYKYSLVENARPQTMGKFGTMFREAVVSINRANNLIVIRTVTGTAGTAGAFVDSMSYENVLGSVAGDDTIHIICDTAEHAEEVKKQLENTLE